MGFNNSLVLKETRLHLPNTDWSLNKPSLPNTFQVIGMLHISTYAILPSDKIPPYNQIPSSPPRIIKSVLYKKRWQTLNLDLMLCQMKERQSLDAHVIFNIVIIIQIKYVCIYT